MEAGPVTTPNGVLIRRYREAENCSTRAVT